MDHHHQRQLQQQQQQRQPYQQQRPQSRASTIASNPRSVSSSSASYIPPSPSRSAVSHGSHGYHQPHQSRPTGSSRPTPQLSREASSELQRQAAVSSFLQERLQKERRAESDKIASSSASSSHQFDMSASVDLGRIGERSPTKSSVGVGLDGAELAAASNRPQSSAGLADNTTKKRGGMALNQMEQVISGLHKQNFDLKLELFHRREKQDKMEQRIESLEAEHKESRDINNNLREELEQRDKAIEEAVAMIVKLEAKVDELINERNMVQRIESDGIYGPGVYGGGGDSYATLPPIEILETGTGTETGRAQQPTISRMPSFLSDRSLTTENLRNVYLGSRGSVLSLRRISGGGQSEADNALLHGLASPTLSVLSESSFVSVYGQKSSGDNGDTTIVPDFDEPYSLDGFEETPRKGTGTARPRQATAEITVVSPSKPQIRERAYSVDRPIVLPPTHSSSYMKSQRNPTIIHQESPDRHRHGQYQNQYLNQPRSTTAHKEDLKSTEKHFPVDDIHANAKTNEEKRAALRKVMTVTSTSGGVRLTDQTLPPTPDTVGSSTLRRFKNSTDTLNQRNEESNRSREDFDKSREDLDERYQDSNQRYKNSNQRHNDPNQRYNDSNQNNWGVSSHSHSNRQFTTTPEPQSGARLESLQKHRNSVIEDPKYHPATLIQRPRSAGETTSASHGRKSWESDASDVQSLKSSLDIWIRASGTNPLQPRGRRGSPDLFGFPTSGGGWASGTVFDPAAAISGMPPSTDYIHDLLSLREALFSPNLAPPAPNRRSSLYAATLGNTNLQETATATTTTTTSEAIDMRDDAQTPVQQQQHKIQQQPTPTSDKKALYPPSSWQQGPRAGLNRLFRRSIDKGSAPNNTECSPCVMEATYIEQSKTNPTTDAPQWVARSSVPDNTDRTGATPPPIMFNPRQRRRNSVSVTTAAPAATSRDFSGGSELRQKMSEEREKVIPPVRPQSIAHTGAGAGTGARRKWLPAFGRPAKATQPN